MTKTVNQIILFSSTKTRIFFSATLGIRIFFLKKNHNPPQEVKWSVPNDFSNGESVYINLQFVKNDMKIIILNIILRRYRSVLLFPKCKKKIKNIQ